MGERIQEKLGKKSLGVESEKQSGSEERQERETEREGGKRERGTERERGKARARNRAGVKEKKRAEETSLSLCSSALFFVPRTGFEPAHLAAPPPEDGASTNFATWAGPQIYRQTLEKIKLKFWSLGAYSNKRFLLTQGQEKLSRADTLGVGQGFGDIRLRPQLHADLLLQRIDRG